jgi:hypothetical protein
MFCFLYNFYKTKYILQGLSNSKKIVEQAKILMLYPVLQWLGKG